MVVENESNILYSSISMLIAWIPFSAIQYGDITQIEIESLYQQHPHSFTNSDVCYWQLMNEPLSLKK